MIKKSFDVIFLIKHDFLGPECGAEAEDDHGHDFQGKLIRVPCFHIKRKITFFFDFAKIFRNTLGCNIAEFSPIGGTN